MPRCDLLVASVDWPPDSGGISAYAKGVVDGLQANRVHFVFQKISKHRKPAIRVAISLFQLLVSIAKNRPRRVIALQWTPVGIAAWCIWRIFGTPYSVVVYGLDILEASRSPRAAAWRARVLEGAEQVWAISRYTKSEAIRLGVNEDKVSILHPGVSWRRLSAVSIEKSREFRDRYGIPSGRILLSLGRLIRRKGFDLAIESLRHLPSDVHLVICGGGPEKDFLQKYAQDRGLESRITFTGEIEESEKRVAYGIADVFLMCPRVLSSEGDVEGFGIVYLEANAAGVPVVATRSGGVEDAIGEGTTGLIVPCEDVGSISAAVAQLLDNPKICEDFSLAGVVRSQEQFDWSVCVKPLVRFIDEQAVAFESRSMMPQIRASLGRKP